MDAATVLMVAGGAGLLVTGGAILRGSDRPLRDLVARLRARVAERNQEIASLETRVYELEEAERIHRDTMDAEATRRDHEIEAHRTREASLTAEIRQLATELGAERALGAELEKATADLRRSLKAAQEEAKRPPAPSAPPSDAALRRELAARDAELAARDVELAQLTADLTKARAELESSPRRATPASGARDHLAVESELSSIRRTLEHVSKERDDARQAAETLGVERDAARERIEALERLVDGVRARSRELSDELQRLRGRG